MFKNQKNLEVEIMKINANRKYLARLIVLLVAFFALAIWTVSGVINSKRPEIVKIESNVAEIRLPGEYDGEAKILYNSKYVMQEKEKDIIKLLFEKQGYYYLEIANESYIFEVMNFESSDYAVDLVSRELKDIKRNSISSIVTMCMTTLIIEMIVISLIAEFVSKKIGKAKKKEREEV